MRFPSPEKRKQTPPVQVAAVTILRPILLSLCLLLAAGCFTSCGDSGDAFTEISGAPPAPVPDPDGAGAASAQVQLDFTGTANLSQRNFRTVDGARIEAANTTTTPSRFMSRVTLPAAGGFIRSLQLSLPVNSSELVRGASFTVDGTQTSAVYVENSQARPSDSKIFRATGGRLTVVDVARSGSGTTLTLSFDAVQFRPQAISATGEFRASGRATYSF